MTESRTLFYQNKLDPKSEIGALIPFYDFANHVYDHQECDFFQYFYFQQDKEQKNQGNFVMKASKNYEKNEQIFICYGQQNSLHFLEYYGFFLPYQHNDFLEFKVQSNELLLYFGQQFIDQLQTYSQIGKQLLSHLFRYNQELNTIELQNQLQIIVEIDKTNKQNSNFDWQTQQLLKILSCTYLQQNQEQNQNQKQQNNLKNKLKSSAKPNQINKQKNEIAKIQQLAYQFEDEQFQENYIDKEIYKKYIENFKNYVLKNLYMNNNEQPINQKQQMAYNYSQYEKEIIQKL
ncbi:hypothetical protein PPERSA_02840 [Pseudocohnilembus persalinus]|uniref:Uncharacterized protein n=1 Tax=Pseudocohnilembus persalinus TaxID=266149 RepID=A0A0V0QNE0_PSEPJ|nr:hypothetical protein PPERSA_02840 [Pseudocohnilembus persalinus]|eukprot:KRX03461.1 hypothetical protein PPERSA_02840 [Pseudocohnilembus persalinus]